MKDVTAAIGEYLSVKRVIQIIVLLVGYVVLWMLLYDSATPLGFLAISRYFTVDSLKDHDSKLESVLRNASKSGDQNQDHDSKLESILRNASKSGDQNQDHDLKLESVLRNASKNGDQNQDHDTKVDSGLRNASKSGDQNQDYDSKLESVLRNASMDHKTVIITNLNDAWAEPGSVFDLFLESFRIGGNQTEKLLNHLVVITWDQKAYSRCLSLHRNCYHLETKGDNFTSEAFFMTPNYLHMVWRKIEFLGSVLQMGYNFVFTDSDIMWLRDPFSKFYKDEDLQISCDHFNGNSYDIRNLPNSGFKYVKSNDRTIWFYNFWFKSRKAYPKLHDQDVLNKIKMHPLVSKKNLKIRFLSSSYFGGFCEPSKDFRNVSTMHANCCVGLENKVNDLRILLEDWRKYMTLSEDERNKSHPSWSVPQSCRTSFQRSRQKLQGK